MQDPYFALKNFNQFILWKLTAEGAKLPCTPTGQVGNAHDPANWISFDVCSNLAQLMGDGYGVAFVFTASDPFFVLDIDKCLLPSGEWSPLALTLINSLPGALIEVSQSGRGLHIIGSGVVPLHAKKNTQLGIELYSEMRFLALGNMATAVGDSGHDCTEYLPGIVSQYFNPAFEVAAEWTDGPCDEWNGIESDADLIDAALRSRSAAATFGGSATFSDLWNADADALSRFYPNQQGNYAYDRSSADAALAQMLAFWTGKDCERMARLMRESALVREKWEREDYLPRTILRACSLQREVYGQRVSATLPDGIPAAQLKGSEKEVAFAENIRAQMLSKPLDHDTAVLLAQQESARLWINNRDAQPEEVARMVEVTHERVVAEDKPKPKTGFQYLGRDQQEEHFKGCVYIIPMHRVLMPNGLMLKPEQFNAAMGGFVFQLDDSGEKTTKKAWEAFTESQIMSYPQAEGTLFRPDKEPGAFIYHEGHKYVNVYTPIDTERREGDVTPFLRHVEKILPVERDRRIVLSYMAACVQYKGVKFQWCPLIQGAEGNGKSLLTRCLAFAVGNRYSHFPKASELSNKFNGWMYGKLFIGVEDIHVPDHKAEILEALKPMITGENIEIERKGVDQMNSDICCNFLLNSNHRDAIKTTLDSRRFAIFFTAQQTAEDCIRDGMGGDYFPKLYNWLKREGGYAIVNEFLHTYDIDPEFNPAGACHRAPITSSTHEAVQSSAGAVANAIREAIEEGTVGMMDGWISSIALDRVIKAARLERFAPVNKRKAILEGLGYIPHPGLHDGRLNVPSVVDENKKPRLYVRPEHNSIGLINAADIAKAYITAQTNGVWVAFN